jgi:hypothetical protein
MKHHVGRTVALLGALAFACASPASTDSDKVDPAFARFVLRAVPTDVPNPTFVDFGGRVHLVGWEVSPKDLAAPGKTLSLKLYWRSVKKLDRGYHLFTHLAAPDGKLYVFDDVGPLRETVSESEFGKVPRLPPSAWTPGMIYVDEQTLTVPNVDVQTLALSVGFKCELFAPDAGAPEKVGEFALEILSGVSDGRHGALLTRFATGVPRGGKSQRDIRRRPGSRPGSDRRPSLPPHGLGQLGRLPGSDKENPQ